MLEGLIRNMPEANILADSPTAEEPRQDGVLPLAVQIVSAYVSRNPLPLAGLPSLIAQVYDAMKGLGSAGKAEAPVPLVPAVPIKKSVTPDYIISLEDGRKFKSMKRHLGLLNMTPAEYRAKWGLPSDYPIVAPNYTAKRSDLAKKMGLGRKGRSDT
jgi:predicted transcriptional regulator